MFRSGLAWSAAVAGLDVLSGRHLVLIGLLIVRPCCVLLTGRAWRTAVAGAVAIAPAVVCGWPDGIFGSPEHLAFVASVVAVTAVAVVAARIITVRRPI
ncbi:hypothetical protein KGQ19_16315 [Catenulispora sp. NL8]|uniref:Integral membrane protein n=1 Tax=Catenulispora pinistramenti TaxID=2705254 RepID=A0ABS5KQW1_9ACTN|nr:hypothetical protein [Catenulispora pinistramenti]MBS2548432.1 hypothetical protein [Catenulispora pinistramenti]